MAFIFPPAAPRAVLCIGSCKGAHKTPAFWLLLSSAGTASALSLHHLPLTSRAGVGRILGGDIISTADPLTRGYSIPCDACWDTEAKEKEEGGGDICCLQCLSSRATTVCAEALPPGKWQDITRWWEVYNKVWFFSFASVHTFCFSFALVTCLLLTYKGFFPSYFAEEGSDGVTWWAHGIQPRSTHCNLL